MDYIASSGLSTLLVAAKHLNKVGGQIKLCGLNDRIRMVFDMSGFTSLFQIFSNVESAC